MNRVTETLVGSIERVTFHNPDNGFAVLKTAVQGRRDLITVGRGIDDPKHRCITAEKAMVDRSSVSGFRSDKREMPFRRS